MRAMRSGRGPGRSGPRCPPIRPRAVGPVVPVRARRPRAGDARRAGPTSPAAAAAPVRRPQRRARAPARRPHRRGPPAVAAAARRVGPRRRRAGASGGPGRRPLRRGSTRASVAVLGDPGAGRAAQHAVAPVLLAAAGDTDLAVACGDIGAPAGGLRSYEERLLAPYADYPAPIYGVPGPADWHDGLAGFMTVFCDAPPDARAPLPAATGPRGRGLVRRLFWRRAPTATARGARRGPLVPRHRRPVGRPARPVLRGRRRAAAARAGRHRADRADRPCAGAWLRAVSADDRPKILLAARPMFAGARLHRIPLEGGGRLNEIVTDPAYDYVAAIGGGDHNYQRYPVRLRDGRTLQYVVAGASGAPLSATHRIPNVDRLAPPCSRTASAATRCAATRWPGSAGDTAAARHSAASRSARTTRRRSWPSGSATAPRGRRRRPRRSRPGPGGPRARTTPSRDRPGVARRPAAGADRAPPSVPRRSPNISAPNSGSRGFSSAATSTSSGESPGRSSAVCTRLATSCWPARRSC